MDQELLDLLERVVNGDTAGITDEDLAKLNAAIIGQLREARRNIDGQPSDDQMDTIRNGAAAKAHVDGEINRRAEVAAERQAEADALLADLNLPDADAEAEAAAQAAQAEAERVAAEQAVADQAAADQEAARIAAETAAETEPVAASTRPIPRPSFAALRRGQPASTKPAPEQTQTREWTRPKATLVASGDLPGITSGMPVEPQQWAEAIANKYHSARFSDAEGSDIVRLGQIRYLDQYPEDRRLDRIRTDAEAVKLRQDEALVASGGVCGPVAVDYSVNGISQDTRPVKDGMIAMGAGRGGLRFILPHTLAMVTADGPAGLWTEANDVNPTSPTTKPHATFVCQSPQEILVDAVTSIVQFGNFQARYFAEQIQQYLDEVDAVHARLGEATLLAALNTGATGTAIFGPDLLSATRDFLACLDRAGAALKYRNRMDPAAKLRVMFPAYLYDMIRTDLARNVPGDSGGSAGSGERLAVSNDQIDSWISERGFNVTAYLDSATSETAGLQGFLAQGSGTTAQLVPWPLKTKIFIFPEGSWTFLDGGELNLGMVRDSTLNRTNDFQMFSETFEKAIFRGHESLALTLTTDPNGTTVGTVAPTGAALVTGS